MNRYLEELGAEFLYYNVTDEINRYEAENFYRGFAQFLYCHLMAYEELGKVSGGSFLIETDLGEREMTFRETIDWIIDSLKEYILSDYKTDLYLPMKAFSKIFPYL